MTLRELADSLIRETQDMRWQNARDVIEAALGEQYRLGFLDGNAKCCAAEGHSVGDHEGAERCAVAGWGQSSGRPRCPDPECTRCIGKPPRDEDAEVIEGCAF